MLGRELRDEERGGDVDGGANFGGGGAQGGEDMAEVFCVHRKEFGAKKGWLVQIYEGRGD